MYETAKKTSNPVAHFSDILEKRESHLHYGTGTTLHPLKNICQGNWTC